jgi:hypothetical protein
MRYASPLEEDGFELPGPGTAIASISSAFVAA